MAAVNFTPIQLYNSTTLSAVPSAANLANGELAINIRDGTLYYKDWNGVVQVIATKGAGTIGGSTTQIQYNNAGALAGNAAMTFNSGTSTATLTTLNLTNALGATYGGTAQSTYTQGDFVYASAANTLSKLGIGTINYILTSSGSVPQWSAPSSIIVQTATNLAGGLAGSVPYQSALDTTTFLAIGAANRVMTSTGTAPQWVTALTGLTGVSSSSITDSGLTSGRVTFASTSGLLADSANLTFNGTTLTTAGLSNSGFSTLVKTLTLGDTSFNGTAVFAAATPAKLYMGTGTVTDVTSAISATNTTGAIASLAITPIAATNTGVTYTDAATLYIAGAPSAGTNVTITNPYSLYIAAGASYLGGNTAVTGTLSTTSNVNVNSSVGTIGVYVGPSGAEASFVYNTNGNLDIAPRSGFTTNITAGGLAVTGALSATGGITNTAASNVTSNIGVTAAGNANASLTLTAAGTGSGLLNNAGAGQLYINTTTGTGIYSQVNGSTVTTLTSTGLAVTGTLGTTDNITVTKGSEINLTLNNTAGVPFTLNNNAAGELNIIRSNVNTIATFTSTALALGVGISLTGGTSGTGYSFSGSAPANSLTLDSSGNLLVGTTTAFAKLAVIVAGGANRDLIQAGVTSATNGLTVKWNHATSTIRANIQNLPTSATGLASGDLYNLSGVLMVA